MRTTFGDVAPTLGCPAFVPGFPLSGHRDSLCIDPRRHAGGHAFPLVIVGRAERCPRDASYAESRKAIIAAKRARTKPPDSWFRRENRNKYSCFRAENRAIRWLCSIGSGVRIPDRLDPRRQEPVSADIVLSLGKPGTAMSEELKARDRKDGRAEVSPLAAQAALP
jgi:hypothetical protein